jgi:uncharacterized RDD family membrane protein YckC
MMADDVEHAKSIWRRIAAFLIDCILINIVISIFLFPFATSLDSKFQLSSGFVNSNSCNSGKVFNQTGAELSMSGWDGVVICNSTANFFFPSRTGTFVKTVKNSNSTWTTKVGFGLDSSNRIKSYYDLSYLFWVLLILGSILLEASKNRGTPGRKIMGLEVSTVDGFQVPMVGSIKRNLIKYFIYTLLIVGGISSLPYTANPGVFLSPADPLVVVFPTQLFNNYFTPLMIVGVLLGLIQFFIHVSILFPRSKPGRGIYDRWAGTKVELL